MLLETYVSKSPCSFHHDAIDSSNERFLRRFLLNVQFYSY